MKCYGLKLKRYVGEIKCYGLTKLKRYVMEMEMEVMKREC